MTVAVVTIAHGRHDHLAMQHAGLLRSTRRPDSHWIVAMDDLTLEATSTDGRLAQHVVHVPRIEGHLPLAQARNVGAHAAMADGATVLIFLDVDCIPSTTLVEVYESAATHLTTSRDLLCGSVTYLPPAPRNGYDLATLSSLGHPHSARPAPTTGELVRSWDGYELFWSLSFAMSVDSWADIGGFDEGYLGYGAEDTDFARRAERAGTALAWVGGAEAFHQHHRVSSPPVEHLEDIVRNANRFHARWGDWPMSGWLRAFEKRALVRRGADGTYDLC